MKECEGIPWRHPWHLDDFDPCFRRQVIERLLPGGVAALSAAVLALSVLKYARSHGAQHGARAAGYLPLINGQQAMRSSSTQQYGSIAASADQETSDIDDDPLARFTASPSPPESPIVEDANLPPSIRDRLLTVLTVIQLVLAYVLYDQKTKETSAWEVALWFWALALCAYLFCRLDAKAPSPSPHLRLVFLAVGASDSHPQAPELTASIAQLTFFSWMDPMIWLGYKRPLEPKDVYELMPDHRSAYVCHRWKLENKKYRQRHGGVDNRGLTRKLFWFFRYRLALQCFWSLGNTVFIFTGPFLLKRILAYMEDPTIYTREQAFWCVTGLFLGGAVSTICQSQTLWIGRKIGIQIKSITIGDIYGKSLRRRDAATANDGEGSDGAGSSGDGKGSSSAGGNKSEDDLTSTGKITNLMAVDAHKASEVSAYLHFLYQLPAQIIITIVMLYQLLGVASIAGLATIIALVPMQWYLVSAWSALQKQLMKVSDRRMDFMNEVLQGVRIIKFFAWEPQFEAQVGAVRANELNVLKDRFLQSTYSILVFFMAPVLITLTTFTVHTKVMGNQLTASVAFTALSLFKTLRGPIDQLPDFFSFCLQAKISVDRMQKFLDEEETPKYSLSEETRKIHRELTQHGGDVEGNKASYAQVAGATDIGFIGASFSWKYSGTHATQTDSSRTPVLDAHTAKHLYENCLMSPSMTERTRILVTHAVGLTIKGASLVVVMQEGRVAAAGSPIDVLRSGKLSEETLREGDEEQQNAAARGDGNDKDAKGKQADGDNSKRFDGQDANTSSAREEQKDKAKGKLTTEEGWSRGHVKWRVYYSYLKASGGLWFWLLLTSLFIITQAIQIAQDWWLREWAAAYNSPAVGPPANANSAGNLMGVLTSPAGVPGAADVGAMTVARSTLIADGLASVKQMVAGLASGGGSNEVDLSYYIGVYILIALASIVGITIRTLMQFWSSLKASKTLHATLLHAILRAPVRFFDTTPAGRLINRFSKDMETIDQNLTSSLWIFITEVISSVAILVVIAVITPAFTVGAIIVAGLYWAIGVLYLSASREIKRFESVTKSPIYTQFGETLNGVSTIRAYGQEARFMKSNYEKIDDNIRPFIYMWGANRWLSIRVDLAGALVSFMAGLLAVMATGRMDAGLAGLSLSYALNFTEHILWVVRFYSTNEMNLNSVERVVEYLDVEPEAPVSIPDRVPPVDWPADGKISVENLELRYAENLPPVIRSISFDVKPREKVGIVGRTGAGKSTLTLAMFRFMEASAGKISIDGIDISQIGVGDLRSRLTIIPQDPILFTGTIRSNLDPFSQHSDDELWLALRRAHLLGDEDHRLSSVASQQNLRVPSSRASTVGDNDAGSGVVTLGRTITDLEMKVSENGSNFSQGQRQLIALARALVKRTRVIILDEATASVDFDTDAKIQTTIRNEFTDSTLLCIAHRLRTIVDYDKVLVLDQGQIVEYDTPYNLLHKDEDSRDIGEPSKELHEFISRYADNHAKLDGQLLVDRLHVTLTKPFYLQEHQIQPMVRELERSLRGVSPLAIGFDTVSRYTNERGDRSFAALDVGFGADALSRVLGRVDAVMERFGKRRFFSLPRFHVSFFVFDSASSGDCSALMDSDGSGIWEIPAIRISAVSCVFGNRSFVIDLHD
ncbi:hypothetical protein GGI12_000547 [Dipsacomyces acuminosporus]|nr:hypothetical protein GGI12_000547 [Dipsacomyces acuminosporus]